jgi:hypothetical protein
VPAFFFLTNILGEANGMISDRIRKIGGYTVVFADQFRHQNFEGYHAVFAEQ